jgi:anti-sigma factor RsiW
MNELGWRQQLTKAEQAELRAHLAGHPEARSELGLEKELTRLLDGLPDAPPVASNFTAQVMQAVAREGSRREPARNRVPILLRLRRWLPAAATACALVAAGLLAVHEHQAHARAVMAERITRLADAAAALGPEPLTHFGPIERLADTPPAADTELTALVASLQ